MAAQHRGYDEKEEMAFQDENNDVAKQPVENAQISDDSAMAREVLLKLDIRYLSQSLKAGVSSLTKSESSPSSLSSSSAHSSIEQMLETQRRTNSKKILG